MQFTDRHAAGCQLAIQLKQLNTQNDKIVLGLPRGGLPVAVPIAQALSAPLDVLVVRKLGVPGQPELAFGAVASGGIVVFNHDIIRSLHLSQHTIDALVKEKQYEVTQRDIRYRGNKSYPDLSTKHVILVDDGIATGATMKAAIQAIQQQQPRQITLAVPVAPADSLAELTPLVDHTICLYQPPCFMGVGAYYVDFSQVEDTAVCRILLSAWKEL